MRRWAEIVLRHRRWVMALWAVIFVAGVAGHPDRERPDDDRLRAARSAGHRHGQRDHQDGRQRRQHLAAPRHGHAARTGRRSTTARSRWAAAFAAIEKDDPRLRVLDEANTGDDAFRTEDGRTAYAMVFYPFPQSVADVLPTETVHKSVQAAAPDGATVGVTGDGPAGRRRRVGRPRGARRDLAGRRGRADRAAVRLRVVPGVPAAARRRRVDPDDVPHAAADHVPHRRVVHRPVPGRPHRARRRDRLLPAPRHPLARGARPRPRQPRRGRRGDGDRRPRGALQRHHGGDRPARPGRHPGAVHAQHRHRRGA